MNKRLNFGIFLIIVAIFYLLKIGASFGQLVILIIGIYFCFVGVSIKYKKTKALKSKDNETDLMKHD